MMGPPAKGFNITRIELDGIMAAAIDSALPAATARGLTVRTAFGPGGGWVMGDPARLQQIVGNLLSNAIKFTPRGGRIDVTLDRIGTQAIITVSDTGQGIQPEFLPRLFDRFQQQDATTTRRHGGLGIGLAIVRQLTLLHGGSVQAYSEGPGLGASFTVRLPGLADSGTLTLPPVPAIAPAPMASRLDGLEVLLVDDEADVRAITARVLQGAGARVTMASTAEEGLRLLQQAPPAVLLSDIGMPVQDGYDLIRQVRALPAAAGGKVPAAAFTAYAGRDDSERALSAGYQLHLAKPVTPDALVAAVAHLAGGDR